MNFDNLLDRNTHLPLREQIKIALVNEKRATAFQSATAEQLQKFGKRLAVAVHMEQNANRYADYLSKPSRSTDKYAGTRRAFEASSIRRQADEAHAACLEFPWEQIEVGEAEIDRLTKEFRSFLRARRSAN